MTTFLPSHRTPRLHRGALRALLIGVASALTVTGSVIAAGAVAPQPVTASSGAVSLFADSVSPQNPSEPDVNAVELGVQFKVDVAGTVLGVRFFKSAANGGTHSGSLWDSTGRRLATATFTGESKSGWQAVQFDKAVTVQPGVTYVASYHTDKGRYAADTNVFARGHGVDKVPLHGLAGVYRYGKGGFPADQWHGSNYYVDVLFLAGNAAPTSTAPTLAPSASPSQTTTPSASPSQTVSPSASPSQSVAPNPTPGQTVAPSQTPTQSVAPITSPSQTVSPSASPSQTVSPSPTPTPTSSATSVSLVGSNCWVKPSACGFPDGTNTGVPAGVALTPSGSITISKAGTLVEGLDIIGCVTITASNVTLRNSRVTSTCTNGSIKISWGGVSGVVLDHVELNGKRKVDSPGIMGSGWTGIALNIHDTEDAIDVGNDVVVRDSYIHDMFVGPGAHVDGVQSTGTKNVRVTHNTIDARGSGTTSAMLFGADLGNMDNIVADNNLLNGGGYTVYAGADPGYDSGSISFTNNRFGRGFAYGPCSFGPSAGRTIGFTGNVWDDTNAALTCK